MTRVDLRHFLNRSVVERSSESVALEAEFNLESPIDVDKFIEARSETKSLAEFTGRILARRAGKDVGLSPRNSTRQMALDELRLESALEGSSLDEVMDQARRAIGGAVDRLLDETDAKGASSLVRVVSRSPEVVQKAFNRRVKELSRTGEAGLFGAKAAGPELDGYRVLDKPASAERPTETPSPRKLEQRVTEILEKASANLESGRDELRPDLSLQEAVRPLAESLLGLNNGSDEIVEAHVRGALAVLALDAFDRAGHHVMAGTLASRQGWLYVGSLKASHGRNVDDFGLGKGEKNMPGRGNAKAVSVALDGLVDVALASGFTGVLCIPASPQVADLYAKMGFKRSNRQTTSMALDLTDRSAVTQFVCGFESARAGIHDVPKDVAERREAKGEVLTPPNRLARSWGSRGDRLLVRLPE